MRAQLLQRAARSYEQAGDFDDAARCWEAGGFPEEAARLHEAAGRLDDAARCWAAARSWHQAARCRLRQGRIEEAVEAFARAGESLEAAWLLADRFGHVARATRWVAKATCGLRADRLGADLIAARCELVHGREAPALHVLRRTIRELPDLEQGPGQWRVVRWAVELADRLKRPDLAALLHAAAVRAGVPDASRNWESWALQNLGDASGIPRGEERPS